MSIKPKTKLYGLVLVILLFATSCVGPIPTSLDTATITPDQTSVVEPTATNSISPTPGGLPDIQDKPQPVEITFQGCPPEGDGGDPVLNRLKNRVDEGNYIPVQFDAIFGLTWPKAVERRMHSEWSSQDAAEISRYESIPVVVEGYLVDAKESGPESTNCHGADAAHKDWHIWFVKSVGTDRTQSIVIETTPRVRVNHPGWTLSLLHQVVKNQEPVRISGWTMFDPEHPDQIGKTRGTLWEIHPIMQIEIEHNGQWVTLDSLAGQ
jgi:hypothetical protein